MGNYCYVSLVNPTYYRDRNGEARETETGKLIKDIIIGHSIGEDISSSTALKNIKRGEKTIIERGRIGEIRRKQVEYKSFPIICEHVNNQMIDLLTGRAYNDGSKIPVNNTKPLEKVVLGFISSIKSDDVIKLYNSLTKEDIIRYRNAMQNLESLVYYGYYRDLSRIQNEPKQEQMNDEYIRSFRKKFK